MLARRETLACGKRILCKSFMDPGARYVAQQADPDGHTLMMYASAFTVSTLLNPGLDPKELQPLAMVATIPTVMITPPGRYKTVKDFVAAAKEKPGKVVCSTAGVGSATHMALERFRFDHFAKRVDELVQDLLAD